jgi:hypothetical protein
MMRRPGDSRNSRWKTNDSRVHSRERWRDFCTELERDLQRGAANIRPDAVFSATRAVSKRAPDAPLQCATRESILRAVRYRRSSPQCRAATAASAGADAGDWSIGPRIRLLPVLALLVCPMAFGQEALKLVANDELQRQLVQQIRAIQARDGVYAEGLIGPFTDLARQYEQSEDYALAVAALDRAAQLIRANRGVKSLDQAPLLQQAIRDAKAGGNLQAAWEREENLLDSAARHPEDLRTVPLFREAAEGWMRLFALSQTGEYPEFPPGYCSPLTPSMCIWRAFSDARVNYGAAAEVLLRDKLYSSNELRELEMQLVRIAVAQLEQEKLARRRVQNKTIYHVGGLPEQFFKQISVNPDDVKLLGVADRLDYLAPGGAGEKASTAQGEPTAVLFPPPKGYEFGRRSLVRLYRYEVASSAPIVQQVEAIVRLADWDLQYARNALALDGYEQAYAFLKAAGAQAAIDALFSPPLPFVLPTFDPNPLGAGAGDEAAGYIDVAFTITKVGAPRRIKIVGATSNATEAAKKDLAVLISRSCFRPRVIRGELGDSPVRVRYYLN